MSLLISTAGPVAVAFQTSRACCVLALGERVSGPHFSASLGSYPRPPVGPPLQLSPRDPGQAGLRLQVRAAVISEACALLICSLRDTARPTHPAGPWLGCLQQGHVALRHTMACATPWRAPRLSGSPPPAPHTPPALPAPTLFSTSSVESEPHLHPAHLKNTICLPTPRLSAGKGQQSIQKVLTHHRGQEPRGPTKAR